VIAVAQEENRARERRRADTRASEARAVVVPEE